VKFFLKFSEFLKHGKTMADTILDLVEKGITIDQHVIDIAKGLTATAAAVIPGLESGPTTVTVPVPDQHAAALGAK
jgi:hypothetical protein